ncbi:branched-chain amino acid ABC transporter permease [Casimicrobium huifangae]|uniref:branched-chain amino acid ABC transporter permease n=1 Tax=Casimicrobium huifangae TaxID=2591109 RepID=UPI0012EC1390|nr:branched-chain amino acid ABC transporter permease [Casimicrobium huifangae]HQA34164.1 branched-chain amino acid ABC transporter permease [Casimicrobium huifangae]
MSKQHLAFLTVAVAALAIAPALLKTYGLYLLTLWLVYIIAAMGLNLTVGYAGLKSLCHAGFMGVGAYTVAIMMKAGFSFWLASPVAIVLCFVLGLVIGFPALRVQLHYLGFATLGFNLLLVLFFRNEEWLTGGTFGIQNIKRPELFGFSFEGNLAFYFLVLLITLVAGAVLAALLRSPWGRAFAALRDNPIRAESTGVNITAYTLMSFAIGAAYAGIAGALFAPLVNFIEPAPFGIANSLLFLMMVVVGGSGRFYGPVLGAAIALLLPEYLRFLKDWYLAVFGFAAVIMMIWLPGGLLSLREALLLRKAKREAKQKELSERAAAAAGKGTVEAA